MSSEMREYVAALRDREHRFHGMGGHYVAEVIRGELEAILARTEAGADGAVYQMMATDEYVDEDGNVRPDDPRLWMDHPREEYERLKDHPSVRSRIVYTHPQDASGDACFIALQKILAAHANDNVRPQAFYIAADAIAAMQAKEAK